LIKEENARGPLMEVNGKYFDSGLIGVYNILRL